MLSTAAEKKLFAKVGFYLDLPIRKWTEELLTGPLAVISSKVKHMHARRL